jgi:hypothetical protein
MSLTAHDLRAIRHADRLVFRYNTPRYHGGQRESWLECTLEAGHSTTGFDQVHAVALDPPIIDVYDGQPSGEAGHPLAGVQPGGACGCASVYPRCSPEQQTWIRALRSGDCLTVRFLVGNNNGYLRAARLSWDEAWLLVRRPGAKHEARYYLDGRISPTFSTCRMIEPIISPAASAKS